MSSIALIGPDGAGKTTISQMLLESGSFSLKYVYMGISIESSNFALPTSRIAHLMKRLLRKGLPGFQRREQVRGGHDGGPPRPSNPLRAAARALNRLAEEWYRQFVSWSYQARGYLVLYDRHFLLDFPLEVLDGPSLPLSERLHRWCLARFYPQPDLVICLDAPADILFARKKEWGPEVLERRRQAFLRQEKRLRNFVRVDTTRCLEEVYAEVANHIRRFCETHQRDAITRANAGETRGLPPNRGPVEQASQSDKDAEQLTFP